MLKNVILKVIYFLIDTTKSLKLLLVITVI